MPPIKTNKGANGIALSRQKEETHYEIFGWTKMAKKTKKPKRNQAATISAKQKVKRRDNARLDSRELIEAGLKHSDWGDKPQTEILSRTGLAPASLSNYINGVRVPPLDAAKKLGDLFYGKGSQNSEDFQSQMARIRGIGEIPSRRSSAVYRVDTEGTIRYVSHPNRPFSGTDGCFLDTIMKRLVQSGGLEGISVEEENKDSADFDIGKAISGGQADLSLGYPMTVKRSVVLHSWKTNFRYGLGAVLNEKDKNHLTQVKKILKVETDPPLPNAPLAPKITGIVISNDVGKTYAESLGLELAPVNNVDEMIGKMRDFSSESTIPVAIVNELESFKVLEGLQKAIPVMPLSSRCAAHERRNLPAYFLSIGCDRKEPDIIGLIEQMLILYLSTEVENTSELLAEIQKKLVQDIKEISAKFYTSEDDGAKDESARHWSAAYSWTLYMLGIDLYSLENQPDSGLPWKPILKRTRERVFHNLMNEDIEAQLNPILAKRKRQTSGSVLSRKEIRELCETLDVELKLDDIEMEFVRQDRQLLLRAIRNAAQGLPLGLPIDYGHDEHGHRYQGGRVTVSPLTSDTLLIIDGFLSQLEKFYQQSVNALDMAALSIPRNQAPNKKITEFRRGKIKAIHDLGKDENTRVILASIGGSPPHADGIWTVDRPDDLPPFYLGGALIQPYVLNKPDELPDAELTEACRPGASLELLYLWTPQHYRHYGVASAIVHEAKKQLENSNFQFLVVEIFKTMYEQCQYFIQQGFRFETQHAKRGRLIYRYQKPCR